MRNLDKRLTRLEKAVIPDGKRFAVVTYDVPIQIVPLVADLDAPGVVYLPRNGRERRRIDYRDAVAPLAPHDLLDDNDRNGVWGVKSFAPGKAETVGQQNARGREL